MERKRHDLTMARWRDADKSLARGIAAGTRGGRSLRLQSQPASRELGVERAPRPDPPLQAVAVFRPRFSIFRPGHWIAVTAEELEAREGEDIRSVRRSRVDAIHTPRERSGRIEFLGARGDALASVPDLYTGRQIEDLAAILGVRVVHPTAK